jgi:acyl-CoA synthetase (AMP-forming)/AMP-acid ligase II
MGRVHVRSPAVANGYVGADQGDFVTNGFLTGDFGTIEAGHRLVLRGRISSFINVAGRKVPPEEVENALRRMAGVADVRVIGAADPKRGQQVVACVVSANAHAPLDPQAVRRYCAAQLAAHKVPRVVIVLDAIPLTARGKTDRARLDQLVAAELDRLP